MLPTHNTLLQYEREEREVLVEYYAVSLSEAVRKPSGGHQIGGIDEDALSDAMVEMVPRLRNPVKVQEIKEGGDENNLIKYGIGVYKNAKKKAQAKQRKLRCIPYEENADYEEAKVLGIYTAEDLQNNIEASWEPNLPVSEEILACLRQQPNILWTLAALTLPHLTEEERPVWILRELRGWKFAAITSELNLEASEEYKVRKRYQRAKARFRRHVVQYVEEYYGEVIRRIN